MSFIKIYPVLPFPSQFPSLKSSFTKLPESLAPTNVIKAFYFSSLNVDERDGSKHYPNSLFYWLY
jgi:hypothetical protein